MVQVTNPPWPDGHDAIKSDSIPLRVIIQGIMILKLLNDTGEGAKPQLMIFTAPILTQ
jgi:hypothetical protein